MTCGRKLGPLAIDLFAGLGLTCYCVGAIISLWKLKNVFTVGVTLGYADLIRSSVRLVATKGIGTIDLGFLIRENAGPAEESLRYPRERTRIGSIALRIVRGRRTRRESGSGIDYTQTGLLNTESIAPTRTKLNGANRVGQSEGSFLKFSEAVALFVKLITLAGFMLTTFLRPSMIHLDTQGISSLYLPT
jgi:hypothetical protein